MNLADLRENYRRGQLDHGDLAADPLRQFSIWFATAAHGGRWRRIGIAAYKLWQAIIGRPPTDVNAMVLATVSEQGEPSSRNVLLKGVDARGFIFFTNYDSRKGRELSENPHAALTFYWPDLERQVCVAGTVTKLPVKESEAYFRSRPRDSQLGAWASNQSQLVPDRGALEQKWREVAAKFPNEVPLPPNWGGFVLQPDRLEFWQGRPSRLHDRFRYARQPDGSWQLDRLSP
jgi:pyridoxamine 5'-phosphate oxidase